MTALADRVTDLIHSTPKRQTIRFYMWMIVLVGIVSSIYIIFLSDIAFRDFRTYRTAATHVLSGQRFVGSTADMPTGPYVYLPITVLVYMPLAFLSERTAHLGLIIVNVIGAIFVTREIIRICALHSIQLERRDILAIGATIVFAPTLGGNIVNGQPNLWLLAAILSGYRYINQGQQRIGGFLFAIPAIFKLWPALIGLWLLYRRTYTAIFAAVSTGLAALAVSIGFFGINTNITYFEYIIFSRSWTNLFAGGLDPSMGVTSIRRPISVLFPQLDPAIMMIIGFALLLPPFIMYYYQKPHTPIQNLAVLEATIICVLLALPSIMPYYIMVTATGIPLIYSLQSPIKRNLAGIGLLLSSMPITVNNVSTLFSALFPLRFSNIASQAIYPLMGFATPPLLGCLLLIYVFFSDELNSQQSQP